MNFARETNVSVVELQNVLEDQEKGHHRSHRDPLYTQQNTAEVGGMTGDAEGHYLDAIEAEEEGDFDAALEHSQLAVKSDPEHSNAWWMVTCCWLGWQHHIEQASKALSACTKVVELDPTRVGVVKGGRLMVDHLGLFEDALHWWQRCRGCTT